MEIQVVHVVQGFIAGRRGGVVPAQPILCKSEAAAREKGRALAMQCAGVMVYTQSARPDLGEYDSPVVLEQIGEVADLVE